MLTNPQKSLLKRAQRQAALPDHEYRAALKDVTNLPLIHTSKDPRLTDAHLDALLSYIESIYWRGVDAGTLQPPCNRTAVFQQRGYWAAKNTRGNTSRDRHTGAALAEEILQLETQMYQLGHSLQYCAAIRNRTPDLRTYAAALRRTLLSKAPKASRGLSPTQDSGLRTQDSNIPF